MIKAIIWKGSALLAVPDAWKTLEVVKRSFRIYSYPLFEVDEEIPEEIAGAHGGEFIHNFRWEGSGARSSPTNILAHFKTKSPSFKSDEIAYVGDEDEDVFFAKRAGIIPLLVATGGFRNRHPKTHKPARKPLYFGVSFFPSVHFVPPWLTKQRRILQKNATSPPGAA